MESLMEDVVFSNVNIFYNLAFDVGEAVNPIDAARKLLKADFAGGFLNYTSGEQEIAERYKHNTVQYQKYWEARQIVDSDSGLKSYIRLIYRDPLTWGPVFFKAIRTAYVAKDEELNSTETEDHDENASNEDHIDKSQEQEGSVPSEPGEEVDSKSIKDEVVDSAADFVLALLGRLAIHASVDKTVFHEDYLERIPFVRLSLQPFTVIIGNEQVSFDVTLTIHRWGIAILTCHGSVKPNLQVQDIIQLQHGSLLRIDACEVPSSIINSYYSLLFDGFGKNEAQLLNDEFASPDRSEYLRFSDMDEGSVLAGIFDAYRFAIVEGIHGKKYRSLNSLNQSLRSPQYFGYPIIFLNYPGIGDELKAQHAEQLAKLIMDFASNSMLKQNKVRGICDEDLSMTVETSLYLTEGSAKVINYGDITDDKALSVEWLYESYMITVPIDILLLQRTILGIYSTQLEEIKADSTGLSNLYALQRELLSALDEFHVLGLSHYGSVHEIIQQGQKHLRVKDSYDLLNQKLAGINSLVETAESKRRASYEQFTKIATTFITALLSLAVAHGLISIIRGWTVTLSQPYPPIIQRPFIWLVEQATSRPTFSTLSLYALIVAATLIAFWGGRVISWVRKKQSVLPKTKPMKSSASSFAPIKLSVQEKDSRPTEGGEEES